MEDFEQQLKNALSRKEQPAWFEAKVLAAATPPPFRPQPYWRWAAGLAVMLLIGAGVLVQEERQQRAAGEAAKARLQLALKITVTELSKIQNAVRTSTEEE